MYMPEANISAFPGNYWRMAKGDETIDETILIDANLNRSLPHFRYKKGDLLFFQVVEPMNFNTKIVAG